MTTLTPGQLLVLLPRSWHMERLAAAREILAAQDAGLWAHILAVSLQVNARGEG